MLLHRYRKRTGLFAGGLLVAAALLILGQFIWQVQVEGTRFWAQRLMNRSKKPSRTVNRTVPRKNRMMLIPRRRI